VDPAVTVVAVAVLLVTSTTGVPVTVSPVNVPVFHTVPVPERTIFPVPNASVLVFELLDENDAEFVKLKLLRSRVPSVRVNAPVIVKLLVILVVPDEFFVIGADHPATVLVFAMV
jgi:hypothetical protein